MTTKQTEAAQVDAKPAEGEQLLYIDLTGRRIWGKTHAEKAHKEGTKPK